MTDPYDGLVIPTGSGANDRAHIEALELGLDAHLSQVGWDPAADTLLWETDDDE